MARNLDDICYKRNFLTEVIARIDFLNRIKKIEFEKPPEDSKAARKSFPIVEPKQVFEHQFQLRREKKSKDKPRQFTEWHFHGIEREKSLSIFPKGMFVKYTNYKRYELVRNDFNEVFSVVLEKFKDTQPSRLGLRYINNIEHDGDLLDWNGLINSKMISILAFPPKKEFVSRVFHNLEFTFKEFSLRYQFGIHNPDYPAPVKRKVFVLDLDAYSQALLEPSNIVESFDMFHRQLQELFELSITDKLRGILNG